MEQAVLTREINNVPIQETKELSFSALIKKRYARELEYDLHVYAYYHKQAKLTVIEYLKATVVTAIAGIGLSFDVQFRCTLEDQGIITRETWIVQCCCELDDAFDRIYVRNVIPKDSKYKGVQILPDDLVPKLTKDNLDETAAEILKGIYPKAVRSATKIDAIQFAKLLGLTVQFKYFDPSREVFGKIFFEDTKTTAPHPITRETETLFVKKGTIWVNTQTDGVMDSAAWSNTIMHECVHWLLHRPAFLLAKVVHNESAVTACRRYSPAKKKDWTNLDRMEWQANALSPRILMPKETTGNLADKYMKKSRPASDMIRMERVIDRLAYDFCVSRQLAKIRMIELGYSDAEYAFRYYEHRRYQIDFSNLVREYLRNPDFRAELEKGQYAYVDQCFVLRDRKFIQTGSDGKLHLTLYAKAHMDDCCLSFIRNKVVHTSTSGMYRYTADDEVFITGSGITPIQLAGKTKGVTEILQELPANFSDTLDAHMRRKKISNVALASSCLISVRQIARLRADKTRYPNVKLSTVISLCIGLRLHPLLSFDLVKKAGILFNASVEHSAYQAMLLTMTNNSIYECNEYLETLGIPLLGSDGN